MGVHHQCCIKRILKFKLVLQQFRARKAELLRMLEVPQVPLPHNNGAESDIREYVTRRKISGGTRF